MLVYYLGQFTQAWDKRQPYETDIKIPFIVRGPKIKSKTINSYPISFVDIAPTILDLADLEKPTYMDGNSFKEELIHGGDLKNTEKNILIEYHGEGNNKSNDAKCPWCNDQNLTVCIQKLVNIVLKNFFLVVHKRSVV